MVWPSTLDSIQRVRRAPARLAVRTPEWWRMKRALGSAWFVAALAIGAAVAPAAAGGKATPVPAPAVSAAPNLDVAPGYFLVQGSRIVSKPFQNERACQKALKAIKQDMQPGSDTLVCAHRRP